MKSQNAPKTFGLSKCGISVSGASSKVSARRLWAIARDKFCEAAGGGPAVFTWGGFCAVVTPIGSFDLRADTLVMAFQWQIVGPKEIAVDSRFVSTCVFSADNMMAAKIDAMNSIVQRVWAREVRDDREFATEAFAFLVGESAVAICSTQIDAFVTIANYWRTHGETKECLAAA